LQLQDFVEAVNEGRAPRITGRDAFQAVRLVRAIDESAQRNSPIRLD
jgi:predicted dehydrogenase